MGRFPVLAILLVFFLSACSGVDSVTRKNWDTHRNTLALKDVTLKSYVLRDAGARLADSLRDQFSDSVFLVSPQNPETKYLLKYKVTQFNEGKRWKRIATFGIDDQSRAVLKVKVALIGKQGMLGAWEIKSWVSGGITGGSTDQLFDKTAERILQHLKGY
jgi:hypothetical protein